MKERTEHWLGIGLGVFVVGYATLILIMVARLS